MIIGDIKLRSTFCQRNPRPLKGSFHPPNKPAAIKPIFEKWIAF